MHRHAKVDEKLSPAVKNFSSPDDSFSLEGSGFFVFGFVFPISDDCNTVLEIRCANFGPFFTS